MKSFVDRTKERSDGTLIVQKEAIEIVPYALSDIKEAVIRTMNNEGVVLNFEEVPVDLAQRMLDFATGAVFVLRGSVKKVKGEKYLLVPQNVKVKRVREAR